jgi:hypothetical protein
MNPLDQARLIGISGKIGSGKTTLANYLMQRYQGMTRESFAENLRRVLAVLTGVQPSETRTIEQKERLLVEWDATIGKLLQDIGEALRQGVNKDTWVLSLFSRFDASRDHWVLDDVRHINEADMIKKRGGILIRLEGDPMGARANSTRNLDHISETALDNYQGFDVVINRMDLLFEEIGRQLLGDSK